MWELAVQKVDNVAQCSFDVSWPIILSWPSPSLLRPSPVQSIPSGTTDRSIDINSEISSCSTFSSPILCLGSCGRGD